MRTFDAPIPGQSLTDTPKNAPYERPPEIVDPIEAIDTHIAKLNEDGAMEDVLYFLEMGVDLKTMVQGILRSAVVSGIHSIDVSLIIAPVVHEYIKGFADAGYIDPQPYKQDLTSFWDENNCKPYPDDPFLGMGGTIGLG